MSLRDPVPLVRCRLDGPGEDTLRYVPLWEFDLWRFFMESRHGRTATVERTSIWIPEGPAWTSRFVAEELEPVQRFRLELPGPHGVPLHVERFLAAEGAATARESLLANVRDAARARRVLSTPGYFVMTESRDARIPLAG